MSVREIIFGILFFILIPVSGIIGAMVYDWFKNLFKQPESFDIEAANKRLTRYILDIKKEQDELKKQLILLDKILVAYENNDINKVKELLKEKGKI